MKTLRTWSRRGMAVLIGIGSIGLILMNLTELWGALTYRQWKTVQGTVVVNPGTMYRTRGGRYWSDFIYSYTINDQAYMGQRLWFFEKIVGPNRTDLQALLDTYPQGHAITVTYNPTFPQQAVIFPHVAERKWLVLIVANVCIILGFIMLAAISVALWKGGI